MNTIEPALPCRDDMLRAVAERDRSFDGVFYLGVVTTGIFCRPSCPARQPKPENIQFYASAREALFAGFRPCKRCRPLEAGEDRPEWVDRLIARVEAEPSKRITEADLRRAGIDPAAARRYFQKTYGLTFQAYARARRLGQAFAAIKAGSSVDEAVFEHDFESHSGFREAFAKASGLPPGAARGSDFIRLGWIETPLGPMAAGATERAICLLEFTDRRMLEAQLEALRRRFRLPLLPAESPLLDQLRAELSEYFAGTRREFGVPLEYPGTAFQQRVWDALRRIPYGETRSYAEVAVAIGEPAAVRAVGHANGLNRIGIVVPCHRVVRADGGLGGYGGGLWRKLRLLETERPEPATPTGG